MIRTKQIAYKVGFSSAFNLNSNEILERRKFEFIETSVREDKKMKDEFHKGYHKCNGLIREVNMDKVFDKPEVKIIGEYEDNLNYFINLLKKEGYSGFILSENN